MIVIVSVIVISCYYFDRTCDIKSDNIPFLQQIPHLLCQLLCVLSLALCIRIHRIIMFIVVQYNNNFADLLKPLENVLLYKYKQFSDDLYFIFSKEICGSRKFCPDPPPPIFCPAQVVKGLKSHIYD